LTPHSTWREGSTKIIQEGLVLGLELLALGCCGWLTLKAKSLDQRREAALMTIAVCTAWASSCTRMPSTLTGSSMTGEIRISWVWSAGSLGRPMLTHGTVLGRPGVTAGKAASNPNVVRERMIESRVHGTQLSNRLSQPVLTGLKLI
jgi:hypothetical protein